MILPNMSIQNCAQFFKKEINDNPNVLSDKTFPELFEAMQNYEIVKVDHDGLWSDFIYLGMTDNVQ